MSRAGAPEVNNKTCLGSRGKLASAIKPGVSVRTQQEATTPSQRSCIQNTAKRWPPKHLLHRSRNIILQQVPLQRVGTRVPGRIKNGSHSNGNNSHGPLLHGTKKANGNAANGKSYEFSNVLGATLRSFLLGAIPCNYAFLQGAIPCPFSCTLQGATPILS